MCIRDSFTDRDGKYQLASMAESGFDPLSRTCKFMLTEEAHHLSVGETGMQRIIERSCELARQDPNGDARNQGGIDLPTIQKWINYWFSYSIDLFGSEISSNAADFFAAGIKGRYREGALNEHTALDQFMVMDVMKDGRLTKEEVPLRNAMNEVLRGEYVADCDRVVRRWNKSLAKLGFRETITLPNPKSHRRQGIYAGEHFTILGEAVSEAELEANRHNWLPTAEDRAYVKSLMVAVIEPGKMANWIAAPRRGVNRQPVEFEYVRT